MKEEPWKTMGGANKEDERKLRHPGGDFTEEGSRRRDSRLWRSNYEGEIMNEETKKEEP